MDERSIGILMLELVPANELLLCKEVRYKEDRQEKEQRGALGKLCHLTQTQPQIGGRARLAS